MNEIVKMEKEHLQYWPYPNQAFTVIGRLIPMFQDGVWSFTEEIFSQTREKCYPPCEHHAEEYLDNPNKAVFFCFAEDLCVGQIRLRTNWNGYVLIENLAVARDFTGRGIGTALIDQARLWAVERKRCGLMLETQNVNLSACRFYHKYGFRLGGVDVLLYSDTENKEELALFWYLRF